MNLLHYLGPGTLHACLRGPLDALHIRGSLFQICVICLQELRLEELKTEPTPTEIGCWMRHGKMKANDGSLRQVDLYTGCWNSQISVWGCWLKTVDPAHPYVHLRVHLRHVSADRRLALDGKQPCLFLC